MNQERGRFSSTVLQYLFLIVLTLLVLYSCATPPPPPEETKAPQSIIGLFAGHEGGNGSGVVIEIRFFPEGTSHIRTFWEEDGRGYSETGVYKHVPESGRLDLRFSPDTTNKSFSVRVGGSPLEFTVGNIRFVKQSGIENRAGKIKPTDIAGTWMMIYEYDGEPVEVFLRMDKSGVFTEVTRYHGADADLTEGGWYELDSSTGLVIFYFISRPEVGYTGFFDHRHGMMYTRDGDFSRLYSSMVK